jgi:hypothetical protein
VATFGVRMCSLMQTTTDYDHQLGAHLATYKATTKVRVVWAVIYAIGAACCGLAAVGIALNEHEWWHPLVPGLLAVGGLAMTIERIVVAIRNRDEVVLLYQGGFVHRGPRGDEVFPWTETGPVYQEARRYTKTFAENLTNVDYEFTVHRSDGKSILLKEFANVQELGAAIDRAVAQRWLPWVDEQFQQGNSVVLDPLEVSVDGLEYRGTFVPWENVQVRLVNGNLVLRERWWIPIRKIPNFTLLMTVINRMIASHR